MNITRNNYVNVKRTTVLNWKRIEYFTYAVYNNAINAPIAINVYSHCRNNIIVIIVHLSQTILYQIRFL